MKLYLVLCIILVSGLHLTLVSSYTPEFDVSFECTGLRPTVECPFDKSSFCDRYCQTYNTIADKLENEGEYQCPGFSPERHCPYTIVTDCVHYCHHSERHPVLNLVSDLYDSFYQQEMGTLRFTSAEGSTVVAEVEKPIAIQEAFSWIIIALYHPKDVHHGCVTTGVPMHPYRSDDDKSMIIYAGPTRFIAYNETYKKQIHASLPTGYTDSIRGAIVVIYSQNGQNAQPKPLACGVIRDNDEDDYFYSNWIAYNSVEQKTATSPKPIVTLDTESFQKLDALTHLYSAETRKFMGTILYKTHPSWDVEILVIPASDEWKGTSFLAAIMGIAAVQPGCRVAHHDLPKNLWINHQPFVQNFMLHKLSGYQKPVYGASVSVISVDPTLGHNDLYDAVFIYASNLQIDDLVEMVMHASINNPIACGTIRPDDGSDDDFLSWAPETNQTEKISLGARLLRSISTV